jgi:hypothetical protein
LARNSNLENNADTMDLGTTLATFTHSVKTRANAVKFSHQSLCNPKISTLLKAVRRGFLKGCPNLSEWLILKYLNPSTATAKGHMKRPRHGIRSTRPKQKMELTPIPQIAPPVLPLFVPNVIQDVHTGPNIIADDSDESIENIYCFGAFADKTTNVVYHDLTGSFPFMSFDRACVFLCCTIMNPTPSLPHQLLGSMMSAYSMHTRHTLTFLPKRASSLS